MTKFKKGDLVETLLPGEFYDYAGMARWEVFNPELCQKEIISDGLLGVFLGDSESQRRIPYPSKNSTYVSVYFPKFKASFCVPRKIIKKTENA